MKLYEVANQKIGDMDWNEFEEHWYCPNCRKFYHILVKSKTSNNICQECLEEMTLITDEMVEVSKTYKGEPLVFTPEERKEIFDDWKKHIKSIPTMEAIEKRQQREKKASRTFAKSKI